MPATRSKCETLHIEPNAVYVDRDDDSITPVSAVTTDSPITPLIATPPSATSEADNDGNASGSDSTPSSGRRSREKRKRSRVTPEQLIHLERYFTVDRSPTAARRREISDLLGMQERQTQIWFQNRYVLDLYAVFPLLIHLLVARKLKCLMGRSKTAVLLKSLPPANVMLIYIISSMKMTVRKNHTNINVELMFELAVTFLPCTDLSIGTWRRIATTFSKNDLIAYVCEAKQSLAWFILSGGNGFKMEIPFDRIVGTEFTQASPGVAHVVFSLSEPPLFYLERPMAARLDGQTKLPWRQCSDWTEGAQATHILRHTLIGSAPQLSHLVQQLKEFRSARNIVLDLHSPRYKDEAISSPFEIPAPPMAGLIRQSSLYDSTSPDDAQICWDSEQIRITPNSGYENPHLQEFSSTSVLSSAYEEALQNRHFGRYSNLGMASYHHPPVSGASLGAPVSRLSAVRPYSATTEIFPPLYPDDVIIAQSILSTRRHTWTNVSDYPTSYLHQH